MNPPEVPLRVKKRPRASSRWGVLTLTLGAALPKTAASAMLRGSVSRRFAAPAVTRMYSGSGGCTGCTSTEELLDGTALSPGHASGPLLTSISTSLANGFGGCIGCTSSEEQETLPEGAAKSQRHAVNRLLSMSTATSLYSSSSVSDCTGCTSSDEAGQESSSGVATVSVSPTVAPTRGTLVSAFTSSSATATLISGGSDDSDDGQGYGDEDDSSSAIEVMTPANGEVICPDDEIEVIWTWGEVEIDTFHVDLHDCGQDACCHDCGEFIRALCAEEGCHDCGTIANAESFHAPQDLEGTGPYYRIVVSADDGSYENGCSGTFTIEGNVHTSGDDVESDELSSTDEENSTGGNSSHKSDTDEGYVVLGSCDSFDAIPYPLSEDMEVHVGSGVTELVCATPKTVHVGGGMLTIVATEETLVFGGIRFEVEGSAILLFSGETATEFKGVNNLQLDGGVFKVAEDAKLDIHGPVSFQNNSVQATPDGPHHGGAIYSQGSVHLRGGVTFADNIVSGDDDGHEAGDGGAVWNGPTARMMVGSTAVLRSNAVGVGGRGGALWNEGFVEFQNETIFALNQATSSGDDENDGGIGGGIYNREGLVRFKGNATFVGNYAQGGAAIVNSGEGKIKFQEDTSVVGNISNEEDGSVAGAVWNQNDGVVSAKGTASFVGNRGYMAGAMLNEGEVTFRAGVSVQENSAVMDGGGFINEIGAKIVFYDGGAFRANTGNGSGGAILNMGRLVFKVDEGHSYTLDFEDNYCGDHEGQCYDIHSVSGSEVSGLDDVENICEIGNQEIFG